MGQEEVWMCGSVEGQKAVELKTRSKTFFKNLVRKHSTHLLSFLNCTSYFHSRQFTICNLNPIYKPENTDVVKSIGGIEKQ